MKRFNYEAKDTSTGKRVKSVVQAESEQAAAKVLLAQGFAPLNITEEGGGYSLLARFTNRITVKDKIVFSRQLATLIGAGLPLAQSMRTIADQTENKRFKAVVEEILADVEAGKTLSDSFAKYPEQFDKVFLSLIKAGEASGTLDDALKRIANQQEKDAAMMSKIKGALTYPVIVLVVIFGVMAFMMFTVVPQVEKLYEDLGKELPFLTAAMVGAANFLTSFWWLVALIMGAAIYFLLQYFKTDDGIRVKDTFKLNVPLFGVMFRKLYMARFSRTAQTLLNTGVPMLDMLKITSDAVNNVLVGEGITRAADKVKGGKALSDSLQNEEYMLKLVPQMIKIGEQSGKVDEMLGRAAQVYEDELDEQIKAISTAIEPILMVVLAIVAGGMVGAILFPIYSLVNGVNV
ncbi:MAG: type pilus assembly protein PilC [Patescibacteria group bacterium]|nr:type pilus assembly protein PilC [Patescibacteria group bacterium]